jgi:galactose mutarotase-like enzyme
MSFRQTSVSGFPGVALRSAEIEVIAVPALGMKLTNLRRLRGREWLWRSDQIPLSPPRPGASYIETADSGGWDECFPTVGPSPVPGAQPGTPTLPDHGELWSAVWTSSVYDGPDGTTLAGSATGTVLPYEFHRRVRLEPIEPVVHFHYVLRHTGDRPFPWIWSSHPLLNVQPGSLLALPGVAQARVAAVHGRDDWKENDVISWPGALAGDTDAFTFPSSGGWAAKLFADFGQSGKATLTDARTGERLEFKVDPSTVPQVGVWINCSGWAPVPFSPYYNLALEPCIGAPDRLDLAALEWHTAQTLHPGEERQWSIEVRLLQPTES